MPQSQHYSLHCVTDLETKPCPFLGVFVSSFKDNEQVLRGLPGMFSCPAQA